ncbi:Gmad2 immunoglobulin-like domain-containing protein [Cytobacillus solani]|uniref:Gmad2 immunoglobulin-like domain-containing protein n=1 Tax=Cytobacillus solani TaxID=1637975 RepID=UPI0007004EAE|nr:Gmad2 immunoglobulin-like domain-containing protein [Cytobacillus solani]
MRMLLVSIIISLMHVQPFHADSKEFPQIAGDSIKSDVFRKVEASGENGVFEVTGEIRSNKKEFYYIVEDGHNELISEKKQNVNTSHSQWAKFSFKLILQKEDIPENGTIILYLFEKNDKNQKSNTYPIVLVQMPTQ